MSLKKYAYHTVLRSYYLYNVLEVLASTSSYYSTRCLHTMHTSQRILFPLWDEL